jgi:carbamoyl-phosphate synthase large subunit
VKRGAEPMRILVTGAGGPSAISVLKSLGSLHDLHMADMDARAAGLYLVSADNRLVIPRGDSPDLVAALLDACGRRQIDILIPTVDAELAPLARARKAFEAIGTKVAIADEAALELCRDKHALLTALSGSVDVPRWTVVTPDVQGWEFPLFAKPRSSAGSRGLRLIADERDLARLPTDGSYLLQQFLPGDEYSVDVYVSGAGTPIAAVPRLRMKLDSGIAVAARTVRNAQLQDAALAAVEAAGLVYVSNVQFRADIDGVFRLLEINPRFPGTLPLTAGAGVDMPHLLVADLAGEALPAGLMPFEERMCVRYLEEKMVAVEEWAALCQD